MGANALISGPHAAAGSSIRRGAGGWPGGSFRSSPTDPNCGTSGEASEVQPRDYSQPTLRIRFRSTAEANHREITRCEKRKCKTARSQNIRIGRVQRAEQTFCNPGCNARPITKGGELLGTSEAPSKQPKTTSLQVRLEEEVRHNLDRYAEFIDATSSYIVSEALKLLFKKDGDIKHWLGQHTKNHNQEQSQGDALTSVQPSSRDAPSDS